MLNLLATPAAVAVVVGEVLFWVLVLSGLATRYLLRAPRLGAVLLAGTVLVDLGILVVAVVDVRAGGAATLVHGLAALYVGFSVVFGRSIIRWADERAAHRWAGGPAPRRIPRRGPVRAAHEWRSFARWIVAAVIAAALIGLVIVLAGPGADVVALYDWFGRLVVITVVWFLTGPVWYIGESGPSDAADEDRDRAEVP